MSEYQYYDFRAVDRPLDDDDRRALRAISTRAEITATTFTNTYEWGDFKGDPAQLIEQWYDLHLYLANWGSRSLMIAFPKRLLERDTIERFVGDAQCIRHWTKGDKLIVDIAPDEIEPGEDWVEAEGLLDELAPLRAAVLAGDQRLFYLAWLVAAQYDDLDEGAAEPMSGLGPMTTPMSAFVEFFDLDRDLVDAAAERRRQADAAEAARQARVARLRARGDAVWDEVDTQIARRNPGGYDMAVELLLDLRQIADDQRRIEEFEARLSAIRQRHAKKERFLERLTDF